jgi:hypothetical protein
MSRQKFEEIEGVVRRITDRALFFRESDGTEDLCIPLSQIENPDAVSEGDNFLSVSTWVLRKLAEEGRR